MTSSGGKLGDILVNVAQYETRKEIARLTATNTRLSKELEDAKETNRELAEQLRVRQLNQEHMSVGCDQLRDEVLPECERKLQQRDAELLECEEETTAQAGERNEWEARANLAAHTAADMKAEFARHTHETNRRLERLLRDLEI